MDRELLQKSHIHSDSLLKIVKNLQNEKQQLENQIKLLEIKLEQQSNDSLIQENQLLKQEIRKKEQQCNQLIKEVNHLYQEKNILEQSNPQSKSRIILTYTNEQIQQLQETNEQLIKENEKLKKEKELLFDEIALMEKRFTRVKTASNVSMSMSVHDMELSQYFIAQNDYEKSQVLQKKDSGQIKLFEDFYIVSVPLTSIKYENPEPMVLFKHPLQCETNLKSLFSVLPMFSYPRGTKCQLSQQQKNDILRVLQEDTRFLDFAIQVFTPNKDSGSDIKNTFIIRTNPDQLLYAVIVYSNDFIADKKLTNSAELVKQKKLGNFNQNIYVSTVAYVILTYYPYHKLFYEIISNIIRAMKVERFDQCKQIFEQENDLRDIDQFYFTNYENEIRKYLDSILCIQQQNIGKPIILFGNTEKYIQNTSIDFGILTFELAPPELLLGWSSYNFVTVFSSLICEQKVAITGPSRKIISYLMILFTFCIKPLKYYHPFVLDVPEKLMPLLEAPVPVFLGIPQQNFDLSHFDGVSVQLSNSNLKVEKFEMINSTLLIELENKLKPIFQNKYVSTLQQIEHLLKIQNEFMMQILQLIKENKINDAFLEKIKGSQNFQIHK